MGEWMSAFEIAGDAVKQSRLGRNCCGHEVNKRPLPRSVHLIAAVPFSTLLGDRSRLSERQVTGSNRLLRSEEHTSELQSLMRISYAVFCLKKTKKMNTNK